MWGRLLICGRLLIGLFLEASPDGPITNRPQIYNLPYKYLT